MKRRTFLQFLGLGTAAAPIASKAMEKAAEDAVAEKAVTGGSNTMLTPEAFAEITRSILHKKSAFISEDVIKIRRPLKYTVTK